MKAPNSIDDPFVDGMMMEGFSPTKVLGKMLLDGTFAVLPSCSVAVFSDATAGETLMV
jgi:hypothetical protein